MKVLHYLHGLPPVRGGGLVKYALDLAEGEKRAGHDVQILTAGRFRKCLQGKIQINHKMWKGFSCHYIENPLPVTEGRRVDDVDLLLQTGFIDVFISFLKELSPDIIHIHSFMGLSLSFIQAARKQGVPLIYTTHDYFGLCPKVNLFSEGKICSRNDWHRCSECMGTAISEKKIRWEHSDIYKILKSNKVFQWLEYSPKVLPYKVFLKDVLKKKQCYTSYMQLKSQSGIKKYDEQFKKYEMLCECYLKMFHGITCFHYNSSLSKKVFEANLGNINGEVLSITNSRIRDNRKVYSYDGKLKIGYLGTGQPHKGFGYLKEVLDKLYSAGMTELECNIYFNYRDFDCPYLCRHIPYKEENMDAVFKNMHVLVVPSLWQETYGMIVLEALSYGVPVIVSSRVGAKELLEENQGMGIVFDGEKGTETLCNVLKKIYYDRDILTRMNRKILEWERKWDFEEHVEKMIDLYRRYSD